MNKKVLGLALSSVFAVTALTACGPKDNKIHIKFWHGFGSDAEKALVKQIEKFEELYPEYKVDYETKGGYDNLKKAISLEVSTGNWPNVALGYPDHVAEYYSAGIVLPLDDFMNSTDPEIGIGEGAHNAKNDFYEKYMVENRQYDKEGKTYGLPFNKSTELMYYNKTVFDYYKIKVPTTWEEFVTEGNKLQQAVMKDIGKTIEYNGKTIDLRIDPSKNPVRAFSYDSPANGFITLVRDFGGTYTEVPESIEKGYIRFDSEETREALTMIKGMADNNSFAVPDVWQSNYASDFFKVFQTFLTIGSSAGAKHNIPKGNSFEVGVAPIPYYQSGEKVSKNVIQQGTNIIMLDEEDEEVKLGSWKLIRFLTAYHEETKDENGDTVVYDPNVEFAKEASYLPVRESGYNSSAYQDFINKETTDASVKVVQDSSKVAAAYDDSWNKFTDPAFIGSSTVRNTCGNILPQIVVTKKSVDQAIKAAYDALPSYVEKK